MIDYTFRECREEDFDFLLDLKEKCFRWYVEKIYGWADEVQVDFTRREMAARMKYMNIIQADGKDIGLFTFFYEENGDACIGMFAILPEYQGKGIGTAILRDVIRKNRTRRIHLQTYRENPARFLYERMGFKKYGETKTHWLMEIEAIDFNTITACGECCTHCSKKLTGICPGCIEADGKVPEWAGSGECPVHACCRAHHAKFCGVCEAFPTCEKLPKMVHWNPEIVDHMKELAELFSNEKN